MEQIHNNPFRVAGVFANASEREIQRQHNKFLKLSKIGKSISTDYDFTFLEDADRSEESIKSNLANLEQYSSRVHYALYWFININSIDELAITHLSNGNKEKAVEIWEKVTLSKDLTEKTFSAYNNLSTLYLLEENPDMVLLGSSIKTELITSDYFQNFVYEVADKTYQYDTTSHLSLLINDIVKSFPNSITTSRLFGYLKGKNQVVDQVLLSEFTSAPINRLEKHIQKSKRKRRDDPENCVSTAEKLREVASKSLQSIQEFYGRDDLQYRSLSDQVAKELMQSGVDHFTALKDSTDPSKVALKLIAYSEMFAINQQTLDRIKDNKEGIKEWVKFKPIESAIDELNRSLENFQYAYSSIDNAYQFLGRCRTKLAKLRTHLGPNDEGYILYSSLVVKGALGMTIDVLNKKQSGYLTDSDIYELKTTFKDAVDVLKALNSFDMDYQTQKWFDENRRIINESNRAANPTVSISTKSNEGCFIATMAYGDYNHPTVKKYRHFRDHTLQSSVLGKSFIKWYYKYSPILVNQLKEYTSINKALRFALDQLIKILPE